MSSWDLLGAVFLGKETLLKKYLLGNVDDGDIEKNWIVCAEPWTGAAEELSTSTHSSILGPGTESPFR